MYAHLTYRIPKNEIVNAKGRFAPVNGYDASGFYISTFEQEKIYLFQASMEVDSEPKDQTIPYCVDKSTYLEKAQDALNAMQENKVEKVVLSRVEKVSLEFTDNYELFKALEAAYPNAFVYLIDCPIIGVWIGATPETLLVESNGRYSTMALAGTKKSTDNTVWGEKEQHEQQFVTDYILEHLNSLDIKEVKTDGPKEFHAGPVKHLCTQFSWESDQNKIGAFIKNIHPTPAVAGIPKVKALQLIRETEKHDREFYAGVIGVKTEMKSNFYVNLRCGQRIGNDFFIYVGGGYTLESDPQLEWEETQNKKKTLLNILQNL